MSRTVKHFNLHRINGTELRVISDVDAGVLPIIQEEEAVIRGYMHHPRWSQRLVSLFILQNLQPLVRQLAPGGSLPPGGAGVLDQRPIINVYDLADPSTCHIFVNQEAMQQAGYWDDTLAIRGLLAHEHAHPLAENETVRSSRRLEVALLLATPDAPEPMAAHVADAAASQLKSVETLLVALAEQLCLYAPREICTNELTITNGFAPALLHLNRHTIASTQLSLSGRANLQHMLQQDVLQQKRTAAEASQLLLVGDLQSCLNLTMEIAPFYRAGYTADAHELEQILDQEVFPRLEPEVAPAYAAIRDTYIALRPDWSPAELVAWSQDVLQVLAAALAGKQFTLHYRVQIAAE